MKLTISALIFSGCALAQGPATVATIFEGPLRTAEAQLVPLVDAMPADKMSFAPATSLGEFKGVRTFAGQAKHVASVLYMIGAAAKGEKVPVDIGQNEDGPASVTSKEAVVKYVKDAFAYARAAARTITAENQTQMMKSPFGQGEMAKGAIIQLGGWHSFDHYGQMVVYLRMNGIVPPASQPRPPSSPAKK